MQVSQPYSSFFSEESLASLVAKVDESSQKTEPADGEDNYVQFANDAAQQDQGEDQDYGDDMDDGGGFDED